MRHHHEHAEHVAALGEQRLCDHREALAWVSTRRSPEMDSCAAPSQASRTSLPQIAPVGRVARQQLAVAVEQGHTVGAGEPAQERRGRLRGIGVEALAQRPCGL